MKKIFAFAALVAFASSSVFAQSENFTGLSTTLSLKRIDASYYADIFGGTAYTGDIKASYGIQLSKDIILNFGASLGLGSPKINNSYYSDTYNYSSKLKSAASISIEPGVLISSETLLYGKISHETAKVAGTENIDGVSTSYSNKKNGLGLGLGVKTMMNKNTFFQFEISSVSYNGNIADGSGIYFGELGGRYKVTSGSIGVGYKF